MGCAALQALFVVGSKPAGHARGGRSSAPRRAEQVATLVPRRGSWSRRRRARLERGAHTQARPRRDSALTPRGFAKLKITQTRERGRAAAVWPMSPSGGARPRSVGRPITRAALATTPRRHACARLPARAALRPSVLELSPTSDYADGAKSLRFREDVWKTCAKPCVLQRLRGRREIKKK